MIRYSFVRYLIKPNCTISLWFQMVSACFKWFQLAPALRTRGSYFGLFQGDYISNFNL